MRTPLNPIGCLIADACRLDAVRDLDDETLLNRFAQTGDVAAFEVLVWRHGGLVRGVCRRYLRDPNDVDDVTQVAFLALSRRPHAVRSVGPWLARRGPSRTPVTPGKRGPDRPNGGTARGRARPGVPA